MERPVYVIGHTNPDTDAITSAMGYAELRRRTGLPEAVPARLGAPNPETTHVLDRFDLESPRLIHDVHLRVRDVMNASPQYLPERATIREAGLVIGEKRIVPVVDGERRLTGAVTLDDVAARYLREMDLSGGAESRIRYDAMLTTLDGTMALGDAAGEWRGRVRVGAMRAETMGAMLDAGDLVILGDRTDAQLTALERGVGCIVLVNGATPTAEVRDRAGERGTRLIVTPHDSYRVTRLLNLSVPLSEIMRREVPTAEEYDLASEAEESLGGQTTVALPVTDQARRLVGIISRGDLLRARGQRVILVDHNHSMQAVEGLAEAELLEVVDHHNLGDLHTTEPIYMKLEPVGSTCTIVAELFREAEQRPDPALAGAMAGGIVSDTLLYRSPTSTPRDRTAGGWLAELAGVDLEDLAQGMFRANSNYASTTPKQLITGNLKVYEWGGHTVGIGQAETVDIAYFAENADAFRDELKHIKQTEGWDHAFFLATDILEQSSLMILPGDTERVLAQRAFGVAPADGATPLPGVVSRKKQVVPPLARALS